MISISIIIPIFNEEKTIIEILKKINEIKKSANLEIIMLFTSVMIKKLIHPTS